jgi:hypothetical protein
MTTPAAGWYPDPAGSGGSRWWDGIAWGDQVHPAPQPVAQPGAAPGQPWHVAQQGNAGQQWDGGQASGQPWNPDAPAQQQWTGQQVQQAPETFAKRNSTSLAAIVVSLVLIVLLATAHIVVLAILPVFLAVRAVQRKEQLAWPAVGITAAVLIYAVIYFF